MKYAWIAAQGKAFSLAEMCDVLGVILSAYRAWMRGGTPDRKRLSDSQMLALIRSIHAALKGSYGSPRMVRELRARGLSARKARRRLMRDNGIHARHKRRYKVTIDSKHGLLVAEKLLAKKFTPTAPNQVWTSSIIYLWIDERGGPGKSGSALSDISTQMSDESRRQTGTESNEKTET